MYIRAAQIKHRVATQLGEYWVEGNRKYAGFSDNNYYVLNTSQVKNYLNSNPIKSNPGLVEGFDCDDFAYVLKGQISIHNRDQFQLKASVAIGIVWGHFNWIAGFHAANWFIDPNSNIYWIEPQTGIIYPLNQCKKKSLNLLIL